MSTCSDEGMEEAEEELAAAAEELAAAEENEELAAELVTLAAFDSPAGAVRVSDTAGVGAISDCGDEADGDADCGGGGGGAGGGRAAGALMLVDPEGGGWGVGVVMIKAASTRACCTAVLGVAARHCSVCMILSRWEKPQRSVAQLAHSYWRLDGRGAVGGGGGADRRGGRGSGGGGGGGGGGGAGSTGVVVSFFVLTAAGTSCAAFRFVFGTRLWSKASSSSESSCMR